MMRRNFNWISGKRGLILFYVVFSICLIYLNVDYSGFDGIGNLSNTVSTLGGQTANHDSCLSRQAASSLYRIRISSPHKRSYYLLTKLQQYETLHRQCGPNTQPYIRTMNTLVKSGHRNETSFTTECSYIIWKPAAGLGNQMISIVSAFLYALLTNRVLLVDFGPALSHLFCEPFLNDDNSISTWILPNDSPYKNYKHLPQFQILINNLHGNTTTAVIPPAALYVKLVSGNFDRVNHFHCDESHILLQKIPVLVTESDLYYVPSLFMTPSFTYELDKMFPEKTTVFHHLGRYLFHPSDVAWRQITNYYDTHLAKADVKVGLQIRVVNSNEVPVHAVMDQILSCTLNRSVLPPPNKKTASNLTVSRSTIAVLVASLLPDYARNLSAMYGKTPTQNGELITVHQPSSEGIQKREDARQNINAWVEMYLLSLCDKLVTTGESTFGYVAEGLGAVRPWVIRKQEKDSITKSGVEVSCWRAPTIDPCCQFPPRYDCVAKREVELSRLFPEKIKVCEDRSFGIRISDGD